MKIKKISDYIFENAHNVGVIFKYYGNYLFDNDDFQKLSNLLERRESDENSQYKMNINVGILKHNNQKQYYIELFCGHSGYMNNYQVPMNNYAKAKKSYYIQIFQKKIEEMQDEFNGRVELLREFYLFDDKQLTRLFNEDNSFYVDPSSDFIPVSSNITENDIRNPDPQTKEGNRIQIMKQFSDFLAYNIGEDKEEIEKLSTTQQEQASSFKSITLDAFGGEEIGIGNPSIGDYNFYNLQIKVKNKKQVDRQGTQKKNRVYGEMNIPSILKILDERNTEGNELFPKYYIKFSISVPTNNELPAHQDGSVSLTKNKQVHTWKDNPGMLYRLGIGLMLFTKRTSITGLYKKLKRKGLIVNGFQKRPQNHQVILQDPLYEYINYTDKKGIKDIFSSLKAYRRDQEGIFWGVEQTSNNPVRFYPHNVAGLDESGAIKGAIHMAIIGSSGQGKTYTASYLFSQFGKNNTQSLLIDNLNFEEKLYDMAGGNGDYLYSPKKHRYKYVGKNKGNYKLKLKKGYKDINPEDTYAYNEREDEYYHIEDKVRKNNVALGNYIIKNDEYVKIGELKMVGGKGSFIIDNKEPIKVDYGKGTHVPITDYTRVNIGNDIINPIGIIRKDNAKDKEIQGKKDFLIQLLGLEKLKETQSETYVLIESIIERYLVTLGQERRNNKGNGFFRYSNFEKYFIEEIKDADIKKGQLYKFLRDKIIKVSRRHKDMLNSNVDFYGLLRKKNKVILQLGSIIKKKQLVASFFQLLDGYFAFNKEKIKYVFVDELTNYYKPSSNDLVMERLTDTFDKFLRENRNQNVGIIPMSQEPKDINGLENQIGVFVICRDEGGKQLEALKSKMVPEDNPKEQKKFANYKKDYLELARKGYVNFIYNNLSKDPDKPAQEDGPEIYLVKAPKRFGYRNGINYGFSGKN